MLNFGNTGPFGDIKEANLYKMLTDAVTVFFPPCGAKFLTLLHAIRHVDRALLILLAQWEGEVGAGAPKLC